MVGTGQEGEHGTFEDGLRAWWVLHRKADTINKRYSAREQIKSPVFMQDSLSSDISYWMGRNLKKRNPGCTPLDCLYGYVPPSKVWLLIL